MAPPIDRLSPTLHQLRPISAVPRAPSGPVVVAIPAKDEAADLAACLRALAAQQGARIDAVVLCLNNCTDDSAERVGRLAPALPFAVHALEVELPPDRAGPGWARRIAMDRAAELAGPGGVLLTTDADGCVVPDWLHANLAALATGADAVAGRAEIEPSGAQLIPAYLHDLDAQECRYAALRDEIAALLDPDPTDPWPRHDEHSGASIAVTVAAYRRAGGIPPVALGEDRTFFDALRRVDARIRHAPEARVVVSARTVGRAAGGMADTMRQRMARVHEFLDERLEPVVDALRRARLRVALRGGWQDRRACLRRAAGGAGNEGWPRAIAPATPQSPGAASPGLFRAPLGIGAPGPVHAAGRPVPPEAVDRPMAHLAARLGLPAEAVEQALNERYFGAAWAAVEAQSRLLRRRPVPLVALPAQTARAQRVRDRLAADRDATLAADLADTAPRAAAE